MPMDYHHQLGLLSDILKNQKSEHFGTNDEYEQMKRLSYQLLQNENIDPTLKQALVNIEEYSNQKQSTNDESIFENWLTIIEQTQ